MNGSIPNSSSGNPISLKRSSSRIPSIIIISGHSYSSGCISGWGGGGGGGAAGGRHFTLGGADWVRIGGGRHVFLGGGGFEMHILLPLLSHLSKHCGIFSKLWVIL